MSSITPDGAREEIAENALVVGNPVKNSSKVQNVTSSLVFADSNSKLARTAVTASKPVYIDSSSVPQTGALPFAMPVDVSGQGTTSAVASFVGTSTLSGTADMTLTFVAGSAFTTFTKTGAIRVQIVDASGNLVDGAHYIQLGSLS